MAGLLDLFNSPEGQQALGLLAAGGPQTDPSQTGFGQRLAAASGFEQQWKKRQADAQMEALKMQMFTEELALKKLAEQRAQSQWGWQEKALKQAIEGGEAPTQQTIPGQMSTPQMGGVDMFSQGTNITSPPQTVTSQPRPFNKLQNLELQSLAGVPNVNERFNMYKYGQEGVARKPGEVYSMADGSTQFGPPSIDKNMQLVPDGKGGYTVRPATGAIEAVNALSKADAMGKGETDFISVPGGPNEPPRLMSKSEYARSRMLGTTSPTPPQGEQLPFNQGNAEVSPEILRAIQQDAAKNGGPAPTVILNSKPGTRLELAPGQQRTPAAYRPSNAQPSRFGTGLSPNEQDSSKLALDAAGDVNKSWLKTSHEPTQQAGQVAQGMIENTMVARNALKAMGGGGWGTETKAAGAAILSAMGVAPKNAEMFAANAQVFQGKAMERLWTTLNAAKGPQTEGDANRANQTWAQLKNTPQANDFILDMAQAQAERDKAKAAFYNSALPIATKSGDLSEIDRQWSKRMPSIFDMPTMQKWNKK